MKRLFTFLSMAALLCLTAANANAQEWEEIIQLAASDPGDADDFGSAVSLDGTRAIVGANENDDAGTNSGSAYILELVGGEWVETAKLTASDAMAGNKFGIDVAISGNRAAVGAYLNNNGGFSRGAVYIYELIDGTWTEVDKLGPSDAEDSDWFGFAVDLDGDRLIASSYGDDDMASFAGAVYVFDYDGDTWVETTKVYASDPAASDTFGRTLDIDGDRFIIGANQKATNTGAAYIFELSGGVWSEMDKITASDPATGDVFGIEVSIHGDYAVAGASGNDDAGSSSGSAYIFELSGGTWSEMTKLTASYPTAFDFYGGAVSIYDNRVLVGSRQDDEDAINSGSVYVYELSGGVWSETAKLTSFTAGDFPGAEFGDAIDLQGNIAFIGSSSHTPEATLNYGAASLWSICPEVSVTAMADEDVICMGGEVTLTSGGDADVYIWADGVEEGVAFTIEDAGIHTFSVTGLDADGCPGTATIDITVEDPIITASADDESICLGDELTLTGGGAETYSWEGGTVDVADGIPFTPDEAGTITYTVTGTTEAGCTGMTTIDITISEAPSVFASTSVDTDIVEICLGDSIIFYGIGTDSYTWDMGITDGIPYTPTETGTETYTVTGTDDETGCSAMASIDVTVIPPVEISGVVMDEIAGMDGAIDITVTGGEEPYIFDWDNDETGDFDDEEDLTGLTARTYTVVVRDNSVCTAQATFVVGNQLGIADFNALNISVYPNPTTDQVTITHDGNFNYNLYDVTGKIVFSGTGTNQVTVSLELLPAGPYILQLTQNELKHTIQLAKY